MIDTNGETKYLNLILLRSVLKITSLGGVGYHMYEEKTTKQRIQKKTKKFIPLIFHTMSNVHDSNFRNKINSTINTEEKLVRYILNEKKWGLFKVKFP